MAENIGLTITVNGKAMMAPVTGEMKKFTDELKAVVTVLAQIGKAKFQLGGADIDALQKRLDQLYIKKPKVSFTESGVSVSGDIRRVQPSIADPRIGVVLPEGRVVGKANILSEVQSIANNEKIFALKQKLISAGYADATIATKITKLQQLTGQELSNQIAHQSILASTWKTRKDIIQQIQIIEARNPAIAKQYADRLKDIGILNYSQLKQLAGNLQLSVAHTQAAKQWSGEMRALGFGMQRVGSEMKQWGTVGLLAISKLIQESTKYNLVVVQMSKGLNIPIQDIGKLGYIADATGVPLEALSKGIGNYWQTLLRAGQGTSMIAERVREALDRVGISSLRLGQESGMSTVQMLGSMRKAFQELRDPQDKAYVGQMVFGQAYEQLIPLLSMSNEQWVKMGDTFDRLFPSFGKDADKMQQQIYDINGVFAVWRLTMRMLGSELLINMQGALKFVTENLNKMVEWMNRLSPSTKTALSNLALFGPIALIAGGYIMQFVGNVFMAIASLAAIRVELAKLMLLLKANPWILIATGLAVLGTVIYKVLTTEKELTRAFNEGMSSGLKKITQVDTLVAQYEKYAGIVNKTAVEEDLLKDATKGLVAINPDLKNSLDGTSKSLSILKNWWTGAREEMWKYALQSGYLKEIEALGTQMVNKLLEIKKYQKALDDAVQKTVGIPLPAVEAYLAPFERQIARAEKEYEAYKKFVFGIQKDILELGLETPEQKVDKKKSAATGDYVEKATKKLSAGTIDDKTKSKLQQDYDDIDAKTKAFFTDQKKEWEKHAGNNEQFNIEFQKFLDDNSRTFLDFIDQDQWKTSISDVIKLADEKALKDKATALNNFIYGIQTETDKLNLENVKAQFDNLLGVDEFDNARVAWQKYADDKFAIAQEELNREYTITVQSKAEMDALNIQYNVKRLALNTQYQEELKSGMQKVLDGESRVKTTELKRQIKIDETYQKKRIEVLSKSGNLKAALMAQDDLVRMHAEGQLKLLDLDRSIGDNQRKEDRKTILETAVLEKTSGRYKVMDDMWDDAQDIFDAEKKEIERLDKIKKLSTQQQLSAYEDLSQKVYDYIKVLEKEGDVTKDLRDKYTAYYTTIQDKVKEIANDIRMSSPFKLSLERSTKDANTWKKEIANTFSQDFLSSIKNFWLEFAKSPATAVTKFGDYLKELPDKFGSFMFDMITQTKTFINTFQKLWDDLLSTGGKNWNKILTESQKDWKKNSELITILMKKFKADSDAAAKMEMAKDERGKVKSKEKSDIERERKETLREADKELRGWVSKQGVRNIPDYLKEKGLGTEPKQGILSFPYTMKITTDTPLPVNVLSLPVAAQNKLIDMKDLSSLSLENSLSKLLLKQGLLAEVNVTAHFNGITDTQVLFDKFMELAKAKAGITFFRQGEAS